MTYEQEYNDFLDEQERQELTQAREIITRHVMNAIRAMHQCQIHVPSYRMTPAQRKTVVAALTRTFHEMIDEVKGFEFPEE